VCFSSAGGCPKSIITSLRSKRTAEHVPPSRTQRKLLQTLTAGAIVKTYTRAGAEYITTHCILIVSNERTTSIGRSRKATGGTDGYL
jgi:hypothetical protein